MEQKRFYRYQLFSLNKWEDIDEVKAYDLLMAQFGCVSPSINKMIIEKGIIKIKEGLMRIFENINNE